MASLIIAALGLALVQYWLLPASTLLDKATWLLGSRDKPLELSVTQQRIFRASANLTESLIPFLALMLLGMQLNVDLTQPALIWLILRVVYVPCYMFGINPVRSLVWMGSVACLIYMAYLLA
jgi:uncharacterized MAPEG superfamily protein